MRTDKLMEVVKRQSALARKVAEGTATDEEKAELNKLNSAIEAATEETQYSTTLTTMKLSEFQAMCKEIEEKMEVNPEPEVLKLLKRNIDSVRKQGKTNEDDLVAVEVMVEQSTTDKLNAMAKRIEELEAKLDGKGTADSQKTGKQDDNETTKNLAMEAIDTIIKRFDELKKKIEDGSLKKEDLEDMWPDWELRDFISAAASILAKLDQAKELVESVLPEIKKLDQDDTQDTPPDDDKDKKRQGKGRQERQKGDDEDVDAAIRKGNWLAGRDMAPRSDGGQSDYDSLKKGSGREKSQRTRR